MVSGDGQMLYSASRNDAILEFSHARQTSWWHSVSRKITAKRSRLCIFNQTNCPITERVDHGVQTIELRKVVGSVNRSDDFDADFLPRVDYVRDRWVNIHLAYRNGEYLPPIDVYKFDEHYYVIDGHHRVSVMRFNGQQYIEASVIELQSPCWN
jgi:hypothetical protein